MRASRFRCLLLCLPAMWAAPGEAQSVKAGIEAWQRADYAGAVAIWRPLAERGDADAAFNLGQAYRLGRGVKTDLAEAQIWLERAASQGHVDAQTTLGLLLFGNGSHAEGAKWLKQAAGKGDPRALLIYGTALFNGDGVPQDQVLGYALVSRAAAKGLAPAKSTLADMDQVLPLAQRKKAVALAMQQAKSEPKSARPPSAKPAPKAAPRAVAASSQEPRSASVTASGGWVIQLGAFSKRSSAETLYRSLSAQAVLAGKSPVYSAAAGGTITRLQVSGFASRSEAAAACAALARRGQACFVTRAR